MMLNNDAEGRWINGTIGTVSKIKKDALAVRLLDGAVETVKPYKWGINRFMTLAETAGSLHLIFIWSENAL